MIWEKKGTAKVKIKLIKDRIAEEEDEEGALPNKPVYKMQMIQITMNSTTTPHLKGLVLNLKIQRVW